MATSSARPQRARREPAGVPTGVAGVAVMGVMHVVRVASLFALVYAGTGADLRADGLAYALIGTSVASLWLALRHSIPGVHAAAPIVPAAMVAVALGQVRERATSEARARARGRGSRPAGGQR